MANPSRPTDELAPFILRDVEGLESGEKKGSGAYGTVYEVSVRGVPCIAKRLHEILVNRKYVQHHQDREAIQQKFHQECVIHSKLKHPNIVHFVGVHYGKGLSLIMERLHIDLGNYLDTHPNIPLPLKLSFLLDVSYGLLYLHTLSPKPIIHRDLTASNILLTSDMRAKIGDLGVSKLLDLHSQVAVTQTQTPGSQTYMPPEALKERSVYGVKLDVFSFGHLALYTATQNFPRVFEVTLTAAVIQSGELQILKRRRAIDEMGERHCLYPLMIQCLKDDPSQRPTTSDLNDRLKGLFTKYPMLPVHQEASSYKGDLDREQQTKAIIEKHDREIAELQAEVVVYQQRLEVVQLMAQTKENAARKIGQDLDKALEEAARVEQELARARKFEIEKEEVQKCLARAHEEVRAKTSQVKQYKKQVDQLKAQVTDLAKMRESDKSSIVETQSLPIYLALAKECEDRKSECKVLRAVVLQWKQQVKEKEQQLQVFRKYKSKDQEEINLLRRELEAVNEEYENLKEDTGVERERLTDENRTLLDDLQGANKDRGYLKEALAAAVTNREELVTRVQLLEAQMKDLSQREELAQQQLNSLRDSYQAMQQKHQGMEIENQKLSIQMHTMRDGSAQLQVKIDEQKDQISSPTTIKESDLESARAEALVYKEDLKNDHQHRVEAFGKMDSKVRERHAKEMAVLPAELDQVHKELGIHQQQPMEVELVEQKKEKEAVGAQQELGVHALCDKNPEIKLKNICRARQGKDTVTTTSRKVEEHPSAEFETKIQQLKLSTTPIAPVQASDQVPQQPAVPTPIQETQPLPQAHDLEHSDNDITEATKYVQGKPEESSLRPFDPNLVCPKCSRNFRMGEIQKFRHHVKHSCTKT